jgi:hypothetical protein
MTGHSPTCAYRVRHAECDCEENEGILLPPDFPLPLNIRIRLDVLTRDGKRVETCRWTDRGIRYRRVQTK